MPVRRGTAIAFAAHWLWVLLLARRGEVHPLQPLIASQKTKISALSVPKAVEITRHECLELICVLFLASCKCFETL